jgi:hypothetical protein
MRPVFEANMKFVLHDALLDDMYSTVNVKNSGAVAMHTSASGDGLSCASTVEKTSFVIQAKDVKGKNCTTGGDKFEVQALGRPGIKSETMDKSDGTYSVAYVLPNEL